MTRPVPPIPPIDIHPDHWAIVHGILQKHVPQHAVWAFGSRATGKAKPFSDLDLAIITDAPLAPDVSASLRDDFSESDLPWKVDVIDWATTSEAFRAIIERGRVVVQEGGVGLGSAGEWHEVQLGSVIDLITGYPFKSQHYTEEVTAARLIGGDNIVQGHLRWTNVRRWPVDLTDGLDEYWLKRGDVVLAMDRPWIEAGLKRAAIGMQDVPSLLVQRTARLRGLSKLDNGFLRYVIGSQAFTQYILSVQTGTAVPHISPSQIRSYRFLLPPIEEQRAIAHILGTLDDKIELLRKQNETLEAMARALFKAWFVDFEPVRAKLEGRWQPGQSLPGLPAHLYNLFPDRLVESELGEIPEGWEVSTLGETCDYVSRGISPRYVDFGGALVLNQKCIRDFSIDFSKARRHDAAQKKIDGRALKVGDVLVNSTGVGTLGRIAQVLHLPETTVVDSHVTVVRSGSRINPMYLGGFMAMKQPEIEAMGEGSTGQTELSRAKLGLLNVLLPVAPILKLFAEQTAPISEIIAGNQQDSDALSKLRDTLLPKLISGELRVPEAEKLLVSVDPEPTPAHTRNVS